MGEEPEILGNDPGDIFTIGLSMPTPFFIGGGFSFDRIVMPDGTADWFFTVGGGLSSPGIFPSITVDRGKIWNKGDNRLDLRKEFIEGFSISSDLSSVVVGVEWVDSNFVNNAENELITLKGGLRTGTGINLFTNYTFDIGN